MTDTEYLSNGNMDIGNTNNEKLNDGDIEIEQEEEKITDETKEIKPKRTPLEYLEKVLGVAMGFFLFFAASQNHMMYYFIAVMLFLVSKNVLSLWNKAIERRSIRTFRFKIYIYLRTLVGIIIAICAYDICLTKHYDTSAYWIIFYSIFILYIIDAIDDIKEDYRRIINYDAIDIITLKHKIFL